jgi:hypothetical protein
MAWCPLQRHPSITTWSIETKGKAEGIWQGKGGELPKGTRKILEVMEILRQVLSKYVQHIVL